VQDVGNAVIVATSSSRFIALNYWQNPKTGFDYQVEVLVPTTRMTTAGQVETLPIEQVNSVVNLMVRDVASVRQSKMPGEFDRSASQRFLSLTANVEGEDLGRASRQVAQAIKAAGKPPRGVRVIAMGQLKPMDDMFTALGIGLVVAVFVIVVLLTAYFQSPRLALISVSAVPGVLSGIATILLITGTTLNIESFMGSIMCLGVSVSNSVMLVTFMTDHWKDGKPSAEAAAIGASDRLRPILMTACAMTIGMVPMALALEEGSQMQAPLGRAVIGGLVMSTVATLLVIPSIFAMVIGRSKPRSPSIYPNDPESPHYDPLVFAEEGDTGHKVPSEADHPAPDGNGPGGGQAPSSLPPAKAPTLPGGH
jgi:multidrug efflux pump subunit AcrB